MMSIKLVKITNYINLQDISRDRSKVGFRKTSLEFYVWSFEVLKDEQTAEAVYSFLVEKGFVRKSETNFWGKPDRYTDECYFWIGYPIAEKVKEQEICCADEFFIPKEAI